jgi:DNA-binding NtrC family response regulator
MKKQAKNMRVLLVDDEPVNVQSLANVIRRSGYDITTIADPIQALASYREWPFDVVITDVRMPNMSGLELLKAIKTDDPASKVILITGHNDSEIVSSAIKEQAWALMNKPLNVETVINMLTKVEEHMKKKSTQTR